MGCGALDYKQQAQQIELRTGGMSVSTQVIPDSTQLDVYEQVRTNSVYQCLKHTEVCKVKRKTHCVLLISNGSNPVHAGKSSSLLPLRHEHED